MRKLQVFKTVAAAVAGGSFAVVMSGCGLLSIESWVKITDSTNSKVTISGLNGGQPVDLNVVGGFLGLITVNTNSLPGPLSGPITVEDVRMEASAPALAPIVGSICVWENTNPPPQNPPLNTGTVTLNVLAGNGSVNGLALDLLASANVLGTFQSPVGIPVPPTNLPLTGLNITSLLNAANTGSADGLFTTTATFSGGPTPFGPFMANFTLNLTVTNQSEPPFVGVTDTTGCGQFFDTQTAVPGLLWGVNSKSDYLTVANGDNPQLPVVINLADVFGSGVLQDGKQHVLRITRVGTFADRLQLKNGNQTAVSGVFSKSGNVAGTNVQDRIGTDALAPVSVTPLSSFTAFPFKTPPVIQGFHLVPTDIPEDFLISPLSNVAVPGVQVGVPAGANFLIVAPFSPDLTWGDNSGFGLGVALEVVQ
jgi:hypothetical protein